MIGGTHYISGYKPVAVYHNGVKVGGWQLSEQSGEDLTFDDTYDDTVDALLVEGKSEQAVTVDSPSPDYPSPIISTGEVSGIDLTVTGNAGQSYQVHRDMVLRSLPDGTRDTWDVVTGTVARNVGVMVFDGTEVWNYQASSTEYWTSVIEADIARLEGYCTHFKYSGKSGASPGIGFYRKAANRNFLYNHDMGLGGLANFKAWLAAQYAAGTPVTILYKLATPTTEQIDPEVLPTYPRYTIITQDNAVKCTITATCKVAM